MFGVKDTMEQPTFADLEYDGKKRKTRREIFLERMDSLVPWDQLEERIRPFYPKAGRGRRPYELSAMVRIHCVQLFYNLSDPGMEDMLYEVESVRRFVGLRLSGPLPDETTILNFRHLLEEHELGQSLFEEINRHLEFQGLRLREGTIVDASIIEAPSSTKNRAGERDPEMRQTKKGNAWHFGMKVHIGADAETGVVHSVTTTPANVHDVTEAHRLLHGGEIRVWCDAGYQGVDKRGGESGVGSGVAGGDEAQPAPATGARKRGGAGGEAQSVGQGESGASVPVCEAALWLRQGPLPGSGQEHATTSVAAGADQLDDSRAPPGGVTGAQCVQIRVGSGNTPPENRSRATTSPSAHHKRSEHLRENPSQSIQSQLTSGCSEVP